MSTDHDPLPPQRPALRIGDAERERAATALGEHLRAGRLDPAEYDDRMAAAFAARTAPQIDPLFADLPGGSPLAPALIHDKPARLGFALAPPLLVAALIAATIAWVAVVHLPPFFLFPVLLFLVISRARRRHAHVHYRGFTPESGRYR